MFGYLEKINQQAKHNLIHHLRNVNKCSGISDIRNAMPPTKGMIILVYKKKTM